ncbi:MAG: hypothetical protein AB4352_04870 [Hormoscilla sp.]
MNCYWPRMARLMRLELFSIDRMRDDSSDRARQLITFDASGFLPYNLTSDKLHEEKEIGKHAKDHN